MPEVMTIQDRNIYWLTKDLEENFFNPLEDIYEEIEKIINESRFGIYRDTTWDLNEEKHYIYCHDCLAVKRFGYNDDPPYEEFIHNQDCDIIKLRSLVNTLGDMIG